MGLLARIASLLVTTLVRGAALVALLFAVHLVLSQAVPALQDAMRALERGPDVESRLRQLQQELGGQEQSIDQFDQQLERITQHRLGQLQEELSRWRSRVSDLATERDRLAEQLMIIKSEQQEYCSSFNPLKRWACSKVRQRYAALNERLEPLIEALERDINSARAAIGRTKRDLDILQDPQLTSERKLAALDDDNSSTLRLQLTETRQRVERTRAAAQALERELRDIRRIERSRAGWLLREWNDVRHRLLALVALVLCVPFVQRFLSYFALMPLLSGIARPLRLASGGGQVHASRAQRSLHLRLSAGETASVRSEYARPVRGKTRSVLLYDWRAPFISYASGLRLLTRIEATEDGAETTLAAPTDPSSYLMRLDLENHPGVVIHPKYLVGVVGTPELRTLWRVFSVHAWATWQLRYIVLRGTGGLIVEGHGDIIAAQAHGLPSKIEQPLVVGFDARLAMSTARTETFLPYLFGKTPLVDDVFCGEGYFFWQKTRAPQSTSPITRTFDVLFSAVGKLLGF